MEIILSFKNKILILGKALILILILTLIYDHWASLKPTPIIYIYNVIYSPSNDNSNTYVVCNGVNSVEGEETDVGPVVDGS